MKKLQKIVLFFSVAAMVVTSTGCGKEVAQNNYLDAEAGYDKELFYQNLGTVQAADPQIITVGDTFYMYATNAVDTGNTNYICAWSSKNLTDWKLEGKAFIPARDAWAVSSLWAPEVIEVDGTYYMYYSGHNISTDKMGVGVAVSDSPTGPFHEIEGTFGDKTYSRTEQPIQPGFPIIDANPFIDEDGRIYLYVSRDQVDKESSVFGMELDKDMVTVLNVTEKPLVNPSQEWENPTAGNTWNEAPFMFKRDGKYYLMYSANYYQNSTYSVGLAISDNPLSGFQKVDYNPILEANPDWTHISGTGHNCVFESPDGTELWMAYHSHIDTTNGGSERKINFDKITFDGEGRLLVNGPSITPQVLPSGISEYKNIAPEAKISATVKESVELLTDDIINYLFNDVEVYEYLSEGMNKITFSYEEAKKIKAIMVYDSADYLFAGKEASVDVGGHSFDLKFNPDYCYVDEYGFEMKIPGSAAILEFEELEAKEVTLTFKGDISLNEIVILGK